MEQYSNLGRTRDNNSEIRDLVFVKRYTCSFEESEHTVRFANTFVNMNFKIEVGRKSASRIFNNLFDSSSTPHENSCTPDTTCYPG